LRLGVDLPLVRDPGVRFGVEGAVRFRRGVVGTVVAGVTMGITDGVSACMGFSSSSGNWSNVRCDVVARDRDRALVVLDPPLAGASPIGVTAAATSSANSRIRCLLGVSIASSPEDSPSSTSGTDFMNATRFEGVFCSVPSNAESFRFKADLLGDFETERDTEELSWRGLEGSGVCGRCGSVVL
jgi:hypothetical protein